MYLTYFYENLSNRMAKASVLKLSRLDISDLALDLTKGLRNYS